MTTTTQIRNEHQISDEWQCYEFYDENHDRWRWTLVHIPTDDSYCWMSGCGMPVEQIDPEICVYIADRLDDQDCNICVFHPFSWYVEQAQMTIDEELRSRIIAFQNSLEDLYSHNAFNSPFDSQEIDEGMQDLIEAWNSVKEFIEAEDDEESEDDRP